MKKVLAVFLVFFVLNDYASFSYVRAEDTIIDKINEAETDKTDICNSDIYRTNGDWNGRWLRFLQSEAGESGEYALDFSLLSIIQTLYQVQGTNEHLHRIYPNSTQGDIKDYVIKYYEDNPTKRYRSVVDVILQGEEWRGYSPLKEEEVRPEK